MATQSTLMNAMLASGGYPWTVIEVGDRAAYLSTLDRASIEMDIRPFAKFIATREYLESQLRILNKVLGSG